MTTTYIKNIVQAARDSGGRCFLADKVRTSRSGLTGFIKVFCLSQEQGNKFLNEFDNISYLFNGYNSKTGEIKVSGYGLDRCLHAIEHFLIEAGVPSSEAVKLANGYQKL